MNDLALLGILSTALFSGTSLLYAALGELVGQRAGIVNLGLEGVLLVSAATGFSVTSITGNPYVGVLAAALAGALMNMVLGYLVVSRRANQLASGLALMFFGIGLSAWMGREYVGAKIDGLPRLDLPGLSSLPEVYASLLRFDMLIWLVVPVALLTWWLLFRTRWGLGLRAVGESPDTVYASGRSARSIRYQALWLGGMLAGVGGADLSIAYARDWSENMTAGRGFIAIALVIFAKWDPLRAVAGALLFSGAVAFQLLLQSSGFQVSPFLLSTMPYVLTLVVLAVWGGRRRAAAPASLGRVYQGTE
jgi:simple sugar transport system permease protein